MPRPSTIPGSIFALLYAGTSIGAVFPGDWITLLIFWALMAITSTLLIWQEGGKAIGAGHRSFLFHALGGASSGQEWHTSSSPAVLPSWAR